MNENDAAARGAGHARAATLGDILYAGSQEIPLPEREWALLVQFIAAGDQGALRQIFERMHRLVFTLIARITHSREAAADLTVDVFRDVWKHAGAYDPAEGSVMGWIMGQARSKALVRLRLEEELNADILTPNIALWGAVAKHIATESGLVPPVTARYHWTEPDWKDVAPGISCKLLAADDLRNRINMLVRLAPGAEYPAHTHAGVEELHLLLGELWIDGRKLYPGDYHRAELGSTDMRVWSETGCTCLLMTSPGDVLATVDEHAERA